ncbi:MAG: hypothetical protein JKX83_07820 [Pseudomonadales bacterium]|nr:hypothetical protein [Pseudomonadales bacterium]
MSHKTVWEELGVYWKIEGTLTSTELFEFNEELLEANAIDKIKHFLVDCLDVTTYLDDTDDAELTATQSTSITMYNKKLVGAFVLDTPLLDGLVKDYVANMAAMGAPWELEQFDNLEDARNWLKSMTY